MTTALPPTRYKGRIARPVTDADLDDAFARHESAQQETDALLTKVFEDSAIAEAADPREKRLRTLVRDKPDAAATFIGAPQPSRKAVADAGIADMARSAEDRSALAVDLRRIMEHVGKAPPAAAAAPSGPPPDTRMLGTPEGTDPAAPFRRAEGPFADVKMGPREGPLPEYPPQPPDRPGELQANLAKGGIGFVAKMSKGVAIAADWLNSHAPAVLKEDKTLQERATFQWGQGLQDWAERKFPSDPRLQDDMIATVAPRVFADLAGMVGAALLTKGLGGGVTATAGTTGAAVASTSEYDRAIAEGKPEDEAKRIAALNIPVGALAAVAVPGIIQASRGMIGVIAENAIINMAQAKASNVIADRPLGEGVFESGVIGGATAGALHLPVAVGQAAQAAAKSREALPETVQTRASDSSQSAGTAMPPQNAEPVPVPTIPAGRKGVAPATSDAPRSVDDAAPQSRTPVSPQADSVPLPKSTPETQAAAPAEGGTKQWVDMTLPERQRANAVAMMEGKQKPKLFRDRKGNLLVAYDYRYGQGRVGITPEGELDHMHSGPVDLKKWTPTTLEQFDASIAHKAARTKPATPKVAEAAAKNSGELGPTGAKSFTGTKESGSQTDSGTPIVEGTSARKADMGRKPARRGSTTLVNEGVSELAGMTTRFVRAAGRAGRSVASIASRNLPRANNYLRRTGTHGKALADEIDTVTRTGQKRGNIDVADMADALKSVSRAKREMIGKLANGYLQPEDVPADVRALEAKLNEIADRSMNEAAAQGVSRQLGRKQVPLGGKGEWYPQVPNADGIAFLEEAASDGLKSARVLKVAQDMLSDPRVPPKLRPKSIENALARLLDFRQQRLRGVNPYLESVRIKLPAEFIEWDVGRTLPPLLSRNGMFVEAVRLWGVEFENAKARIELVGKDTQPAVAEALNEFFGAHFNMSGRATQESRALAGAVSNYESTARLGFSPLSALRNMGQRFSGTVLAEPGAVFKATAKYPPVVNLFMRSARNLRQQIQRRGVTSPLTEISTPEQNVPGERLTKLALAPFRMVEGGNQTTTALIAASQIERDVARLAESGPVAARTRLQKIRDAIISATGVRDPIEAAERRVEKAGMDADELIAAYKAQDGKLTDEQLDRAMYAMVRDTQFPLTMATERIWWRAHPWIRLLAKFKPYGLDQVGLIANHVVMEAARGNFGPVTRFAVAMVLTGEVYNIARDLVRDDDESVAVGLTRRPDERNWEGVRKRLLSNFADGGGLGMVADLTYGIGDYLWGPVGSTLENAKTALINIIRRPSMTPEAISKFISSEVSVVKQIDGAIAKADRRLLNPDNHLAEYVRTRQRVFEWKGEQEKRPFNKVMVGLIAGKVQEFVPGENTLAYEYIARNVTVGDTADAASYVRMIFDSAETPADRKKALAGLKASRSHRSPLGPIPDKDLSKFLATLTADERASAMNLEREWVARWDAAVKQAPRRRQRN